jgi:hypothetical protein
VYSAFFSDYGGVGTWWFWGWGDADANPLGVDERAEAVSSNIGAPTCLNASAPTNPDAKKNA